MQAIRCPHMSLAPRGVSLRGKDRRGSLTVAMAGTKKVGLYN